MSSIDERVVQMKFDNTQFQSGVAATKGALDTLKKNLNFEGAKKGLDGLNAATKGFSLSGMASGIDSLVSKFSTLNIMGITALTNIVNKATNAGLQMAKSLTLDPVKAGFDEYELKMGSIQTILSNTARYGTTLGTVTKNLDALNLYADKTIYNFADMTKNIGLFTNAGIRVGEATKMIKGFSNEAAASGTSAEGASGAAYQLSQALSAGKITLMDWRSLQNVGMGNANMKKGIIDIATAMGTMKSKGVSAKDAQKDFNGTLEKGWLTADVMSKYLKIMAGEMSAASMKQMGLSKAQIAAFQKQQKNAEEAATKVRTFSQLIGTMRESVGSGWTDTFGTIIGDFNQATTLWTNVNDTLGGMIGKISDARNNMLKSWAKEGGRTALIGGLGNAFKALMGIIKPLHDAFRDFFPATTGKQLAYMTKQFEAFTKKLIPGKETMAQLRTIFGAVFGVLAVGWSVIKGIVVYFATFFGVVAGGTGGLLSFVAGIASVITGFTKWLQEGDKIVNFFKALAAARTAVLEPIVAVVSKIVGAFGLLFKGDFSGFVSAIKGAFSGLDPIVAAIQGKINNLFDLFNTGVNYVRNFFGAASSSTAASFVAILGTIQAKVQELRGYLNLGIGSVHDLFGALNSKINTAGMDGASKATSFLASAGEKAGRMWDGLVNAFGNMGQRVGPMMDGIGQLFTVIKDKLVEYIKGLDFQDAVALLNTGFFIAMYKMMTSFVKQLKGLASDFSDVLSSISGAFGKLTDVLGAMQKSIEATTLLKIAAAVGLLVVSLILLANVDPKKLAVGIGAIAALMAELMGTMKVFSMMNPAGGMAKAATALVLLAIAVDILASAVNKLGGMDWATMAKGLIGTAGLLAALALFTKFSSADGAGVKVGAGLILLAVAIRILSGAVQTLGSMDLGSLIKGILAMNIMISSLMAIVSVMNGTKGIPQAAAGILILSVALAALTVTMRLYAALDWMTLIKGLGTMALTLVLVGRAMQTMPKDMPSKAAGLLIVSAAMIVLAGALKMMGGMSVEEIAKALVTLSVSLGIISVALIAMEASIPGAQALIIASGALLVLSGVLMILGSMDIQSVGIALLAIAGVLTILGVAAALMIPLAPGLELLAGAVMAMGLAMLAAGAGFALFATGFAIMAAVGTAGVAVLIAAFTGILNLIPLFMEQIALGLRAFAVVIAGSGPAIVGAITTLLMSLLQAIRTVIPEAIATMVEFLTGMLQAIRTLIPQAVATIIVFITAVLAAIRIIAPQFVTTMGVIIMSMVNKISALVPQIAAAGLRMITALLRAIGNEIPKIVKEATDLMTKFMDAIAKAVPELVRKGFKMVIDLINGVSDAIDQNSATLGAAGGRLASSIIQGMLNAITTGARQVIGSMADMARSALSAVTGIFDVHSPSREMYKIGKYVVEGFVKGIHQHSPKAVAEFDTMKKMLADLQVSTKKNADAAEKNLYKLTHAKKKNKKAIADARRALAQANLEEARANAASRELTKYWTDDRNRLNTLGKAHDALGEKIKAATQKLVDAKKVRDDYYGSIKTQYNVMPDITTSGENQTTVQDFANDLRKQINDVRDVSATMGQLRKLGLNDTLYKDLLAKGPDALPFMKELLGTGKSGVTQLNTLTKDLDGATAGLAYNTSHALYQAGVDSAAGIVKGLESQQKNIEIQMDRIADAMVKAIKKKLGIKSPSRVFAQVGKYSAQGVSKGLDNHTKMVAKSATAMGHEAINSLRKSITGLDDIVSRDIRTDPVISPVLDLSAVRKDASTIGSLLGAHGISVSAGYSTAKEASSGYQANNDARAFDQTVVDQKTDLSFVQNNYSPKALSAADSYRNTKNLISTAKGALTK